MIIPLKIHFSFPKALTHVAVTVSLLLRALWPWPSCFPELSFRIG